MAEDIIRQASGSTAQYPRDSSFVIIKIWLKFYSLLPMVHQIDLDIKIVIFDKKLVIS